MKQVLDAEQLRELLEYRADEGLFYWRKPRHGVTVGAVAGYVNTKGYRMIFVNGKLYKASRLAWLYTFGEWPEGELDHRDLDKQNDRTENLRDATRHQNGCNRDGWASSGLKGAYFLRHLKKKPWLSVIRSKGKKFHLGYYSTAEEAHAAYCDAAARLHSSFARTSCAS